MPVKSPGQARLISATAAARKNLHCGKTPDKALCVEDYDDGAGNAGAGSGEDKDEQEHDDGNSVFSLLVGCSGEKLLRKMCQTIIMLVYQRKLNSDFSQEILKSALSRICQKMAGSKKSKRKNAPVAVGLFWYHGVFLVSGTTHQCLLMFDHNWLAFHSFHEKAMKQKLGCVLGVLGIIPN